MGGSLALGCGGTVVQKEAAGGAGGGGSGGGAGAGDGGTGGGDGSRVGSAGSGGIILVLDGGGGAGHGGVDAGPMPCVPAQWDCSAEQPSFQAALGQQSVAGYDQNRRAVSTTSSSLRHWSSSVTRLPFSVEAKPHCGDRARRLASR